MNAKNWISFLGTAGARMVMSRQIRSSAGIVLGLDGRLIVVDPGPGTLVRFRSIRPALDADAIDAVVLSHRHIDHSCDANVMIECMTRGGTRRRGAVFAPGDCINGIEPVVFHYLRPAVENLVVLEPHSSYDVHGISFHTAGYHDHPVQTLGLMFDTPGGRLTIVSDTLVMDELEQWYSESHVLVINVVRYLSAHASHAKHMTCDDARWLISAVRPRVAVLTHFGMSVLDADPDAVAGDLTQRTGVLVLAASDGMMLPLDGIQCG